MIKVFVHSYSADAEIGVETLREMSQHTICAPHVWEGLYEAYGPKFKGRLLLSEDQQVLGKSEMLANKFHDKIKVYDVSRAVDKIRAVKQGIRKTPTVIVQGKKYEGLEKILQLIE